MSTLVFDIDGTLADQWPLERTVLESLVPKDVDLEVLRVRMGGRLRDMYQIAANRGLSKNAFDRLYSATFVRLQDRGLLPMPVAFKSVEFIRANADRFNFVYATGGLSVEAEYILASLGLAAIFDIRSSISRDNCRYTKASGLPFKRLRRIFDGPMIVVTDSTSDSNGANKAGLPALLVTPNAPVTVDQLIACINLYNGGQL